MANKNKQKGSYHERKIEDWFKQLDIEAERQPLSGSLGGKYRGDIKLNLRGMELIVEVKYRDKSNFPSPFSVLEGRDMAVFKRRTGSPQTVVIMPAELFERLVSKENNHDQDTDGNQPPT
jgi:Holliday junction resolvase